MDEDVPKTCLDQQQHEHDEEEIKKLPPQPQLDIWASIIAQTQQQQQHKEPSPNLDSPYIHPLIKRSSSLSEKSLLICTESLGSETGSDGFSSYPPSETSSQDGDGDHEEQQQHYQETHVVLPHAYNFSPKLAPTKSFPPPLTSLSGVGVGVGVDVDAPSMSIRMHSHRKNGRLVLEAVSIPTHNYFDAHRHHGRLQLTFAKNLNTIEDHPEIVEQVIEQLCHDEVNTFEKGSIAKVEMGIVATTNRKAVDVPSVQVPRIMNNFNKVIRLANTSPTWLKFDGQDKETEPTPNSKQYQKSMSPRMRLSPSKTTFNAYENSWRSKKVGAYINSPHMQRAPPLKNNNKNMLMLSKLSSNEKAKEEQKRVITRGGGGGGEVNGCKETRKPVLFWEPHCSNTSTIATS